MAVDLSNVGLHGLQVAAGLRQSQATTRATHANATATEIANERAQTENRIEQEALAKLSSVAMGNRGSGGQDILTQTNDTSKGAPLEQIGALMIAGGAISRGTEYLKAGVDIRRIEDQMLTNVESRNKTRLDNIISTGDLFSRTVGTARNQSEWEYGLAQMENSPEAIAIFGQENFDALKNMEYDPNVAAFLNERAMSAKERASLELQEQGNTRADRNALDTAAYRSAQLDIARGNLQARREENERRAKNDGASAATSPTPSDLRSAEAAVANLIFDGKVPTEADIEYVAFKSGAQDIASRARQMVRDQVGLDFNAAITRATIESKTNGDWMTMDREDDRGWLQRVIGRDAPEPAENARYRGRGMRAVDAVQMPSSRSALETGMYYVTPRGIAKWDGTNFVKDE